MKYPYLSKSKIEQAALSLIVDAFGEGYVRIPLLDLEAVVFDHLYETESLYFTNESDLGYEDGNKVIGKTSPIAGKIEICKSVREVGPVGRYRFTVGHELGHWVLHRPLFLADQNQLTFEMGAESENGPITSLNRDVFPSGTGRVPTEEWQANRFAIALLVDMETLRTEFESRFTKGPIRCEPGTLRTTSRNIARETVNGLKPLAETFGLSNEAMAISLESRAFVTDRNLLL